MAHCNACDAPAARCACSVPVSVHDRLWGGSQDGELSPREFIELMRDREPVTEAPRTITLDQAVTLIRLALAILGVSVTADRVRRVAAQALLDLPGR